MGDSEAGTAQTEVTLRSTAFNRSTLERTVVSGAERHGLDYRVGDAKHSLNTARFHSEVLGDRRATRGQLALDRGAADVVKIGQ